MTQRYITSIRATPDSVGLFYDIDFRADDPTGATPRLEDDEVLESSESSVESPMTLSGFFYPAAAPKFIRIIFTGGLAGQTYHVAVTVETSGSAAKLFDPRTYTRTFEIVMAA